MLPPGFHTFSASAENLTLLADAGDFFQLVSGASPFLLLSVSVFQRGSTTLAMDTILLHRGTLGAGGAAPTNYELGTAGPAATVAAGSLPTTDVSTDDWQKRLGWNLLQSEAIFMPIPALWVPFKAGDDLGITRATTIAHTGVGVQVEWAEFIGS